MTRKEVAVALQSLLAGLKRRMMAPRFTVETVGKYVHVVRGEVKRGRQSVFAIFRDEMFFCPAFLQHYRSLGVDQFIIIDDGSIDGTKEYLLSQPDCVVLASDLRFGDSVRFTWPDGSSRRTRAGACLKVAVPQMLLEGEYVTYVDADEFLILPSDVKSLAEVVERLKRDGKACALSSVVEFFPRRISDLDQPHVPQSFSDLIERYPYFEAEPVVEVDADGRHRFLNASKSMQLFERYAMPHAAKGSDVEYRETPRHKTPVSLRTNDSFMLGSHRCSAPAATDILLSMAHFVFTANSREKFERALQWRSHVGQGDKYGYYEKLYEAMSADDADFLGPLSQRYNGPEQLTAAGLIKW